VGRVLDTLLRHFLTGFVDLLHLHFLGGMWHLGFEAYTFMGRYGYLYPYFHVQYYLMCVVADYLVMVIACLGELVLGDQRSKFVKSCWRCGKNIPPSSYGNQK
jgi:hypothetical protein